MNKTLLFFVTVFMSAFSYADAEQYDYGLSSPGLLSQHETTTERLLKQQRLVPVTPESELSAQLYVDSQIRIGETFKTAIPDSLQERADSLSEGD
ncbi:hypothetical protein [Alcanivorax borkumensis]|jgi:hypothetical protein|uniref:hypothetical protein n=1 Tax=Alcanivorax borkumensis TaxID=59754 RepID=UPI0035629EA8